MRTGSHEYANEADDDDDVPKPAQSLGTPVPRQKGGKQEVTEIDDIIHNSSYRQSDSAFLTELGELLKNAESD